MFMTSTSTVYAILLFVVCVHSQFVFVIPVLLILFDYSCKLYLYVHEPSCLEKNFLEYVYSCHVTMGICSNTVITDFF